MIRKIVVLGGGSAGFLTALALQARLPKLGLTVVRSKEIGIIGVGEATTANMPRFLFDDLRLDPLDFHRKTMLSWKLGIRFLWGARPHFDFTFGSQMDVKWSRLSRNNGFYCRDEMENVDQHSALMSRNKIFLRRPDGLPQIGAQYGYHLENERFVKYLEGQAVARGIQVVEDTVAKVRTDKQGIAALKMASGTDLKADLFVDCSGYRSLLLGQALKEPFVSYGNTLFNDRAVVGAWPRTDEPIQPYTTAETMSAGWCWRIDHPDIINRGYVYSSAFISDHDAEKEFRAKNPRAGSTRIVPFVTGRYNRSWVKNVIALGNASGFVEPLESTGLAMIVMTARLLSESIEDCGGELTPTLQACCNRIIAEAWDSISYFLGFHFKFNTRLNTKYWKHCREKTDLGYGQLIADYFAENGPSTYGRTALLGNQEYAGMEGYLCMLVGQKVPYQAEFEPTSKERAIWSGVKAENRARALTALGVHEALAVINDPDFAFDPASFRWGPRPETANARAAQPTVFR